MKGSVSIATVLLAASASALFDKTSPWGKRDYDCVNVFQGIPDNSTLTPGSTVEIKFNREPTTLCPDSGLSQYPGDDYSLTLYNNPVRVPNSVNFDQEIRLQTGIKEDSGSVTFTVPTDLPQVNDSSLWYLRLSTGLSTAPQMPTLYNAAGPFTIQTA